MIHSATYDVEILPNFFSVTIIDIPSYMETFKESVDKKGNPIPITQKFTVSEIKDKLDKVKHKSYYITDTDDSQLFSMLAEFNQMRPYKDNKGIYHRTDLFAYNSNKYDRLMIACFLMYATNIKTSKELITKLYETSKRIINLQNDSKSYYTDHYLNTLKRYQLPYVDIDVMLIFALNKVGKGKDKAGNNIYFPKSLKQTSINLQWYELYEYEMPKICDKDKYLYNKLDEYRGLDAKALNQLVDVWDRYIIDEYIPDMMYYNKNDCFILCELIRLNMNEVRSRYAISNSYKVNVLNSSRSKIADVLFDKFYSEFSGLHPKQWKGRRTERTKMAFKKVILPMIHFKTPELKSLLEDMKKVVVTSVSKDSFTRTVKLGKLDYTLATGGLHSKDIPRELRSNMIAINPSTGKEMQSILDNLDNDEDIWEHLTDNSYIYVHYDIASFYPFIISKYGISPAHLSKDVFVKLVTWLATSRVGIKHTKDTHVDGIRTDIFALILKIVINSIYGKLGFELGDIYDRLAVLKVTINGQLLMMMLCERLELNGIEIVSANTDGIVVKLYKTHKDIFNDICNAWKKETKLSADSEYYKCYINRDINNYFIQELNGKMTYKGALNPYMYLADLSKGYDMPIVAKAVVDYFIQGKPILETLYEADNILDFCKTQNVGRQYHVGYIPYSKKDDYVLNTLRQTNVEIGKPIKIQRNVRYYVSNNGGGLQKIHNYDNSTNSLASGKKVTICNSLDDRVISFRNIDYMYYHNECIKIINPIKLQISPTTKANATKGTKSGKAILKKYSGMYNTLFDNNYDEI